MTTDTLTTDTTFPKHCQMAEDEALKSILEPAIDALAEYVYGDLSQLDHALTLAKETIEVFPHREEPKAMLTLIRLFKGATA